MNIYPAYISKQNSNDEKQIIILMIINGEGWHYPAVKKLSESLKSVISIKKKHRVIKFNPKA